MVMYIFPFLREKKFKKDAYFFGVLKNVSIFAIPNGNNTIRETRCGSSAG